MNQVATLNELLIKFGIPEEYTKYIVIVFSILLIASMIFNVLEKLGILTWFNKIFSKKSNTEDEIKALNLLSEFKIDNDKLATEYPYVNSATHQKEISLLNNFFGSRFEDIYLLRYLFSRVERKRAYRLYNNHKFSWLIKKNPSTQSYQLKSFLYIPLIYFFAGVWVIGYSGITIFLVWSLFMLYEQITGLQIIAFYILAIILPFAFAFFCGFLMIPYQAKLFVELEKVEEKTASRNSSNILILPN